MKVAVIDNSTDSELTKVILWQYDNATNLIQIIEGLRLAYEHSTQDFWDSWADDVVDIDTANDYGLAVWGNLLGVKRPSLTVSGTATILSTALYRKIIKARFKLLGSNASIEAYCTYLGSIFNNRMRVTDNKNMSMTFTGVSLTAEESALVAQHPETVFLFPAGVREPSAETYGVFAFNGQQLNTTVSDPVACGFGNSRFKATA